MPCSCNPIFINDGTATAMCAWKSKKWRSSNWYLPWITPKWCSFSTNYSCFRSTNRRYSTIFIYNCFKKYWIFIMNRFISNFKNWLYIPALFAADNVYRFGLSRLSSKISLESCCETSSSVEGCVVLIIWTDVVLVLIVDVEDVVIFCVEAVAVTEGWVGFRVVIVAIVGFEKSVI